MDRTYHYGIGTANTTTKLPSPTLKQPIKWHPADLTYVSVWATTRAALVRAARVYIYQTMLQNHEKIIIYTTVNPLPNYTNWDTMQPNITSNDHGAYLPLLIRGWWEGTGCRQLGGLQRYRMSKMSICRQNRKNVVRLTVTMYYQWPIWENQNLWATLKTMLKGCLVRRNGPNGLEQHVIFGQKWISTVDIHRKRISAVDTHLSTWI